MGSQKLFNNILDGNDVFAVQDVSPQTKTIEITYQMPQHSAEPTHASKLDVSKFYA
jgi:hypothetical protein